MTLVAHTAGLIDAWGFAYVGSVLGAVVSGLWIVRSEIGDRSSRARYQVPRWTILVGFVCGGSLGLGSARMLEHALSDPPNAASVAREVCAAGAAADVAVRLSRVHADIDHIARDVGESAALDEAHTRLHDLVAQRADPDLVRVAISDVVTELQVLTPETGVEECRA